MMSRTVIGISRQILFTSHKIIIWHLKTIYFEICQKLDGGCRFPGLAALQQRWRYGAVCASSQNMVAHGQHAAHITSFVCVYEVMHNVSIYMCCWLIQNKYVARISLVTLEENNLDKPHDVNKPVACWMFSRGGNTIPGQDAQKI